MKSAPTSHTRRHPGVGSTKFIAAFNRPVATVNHDTNLSTSMVSSKNLYPRKSNTIPSVPCTRMNATMKRNDMVAIFLPLSQLVPALYLTYAARPVLSRRSPLTRFLA